MWSQQLYFGKGHSLLAVSSTMHFLQVTGCWVTHQNPLRFMQRAVWAGWCPHSAFSSKLSFRCTKWPPLARTVCMAMSVTSHMVGGPVHASEADDVAVPCPIIAFDGLGMLKFHPAAIGQAGVMLTHCASHAIPYPCGRVFHGHLHHGSQWPLPVLLDHAGSQSPAARGLVVAL